jgi:uncharacterized protein involved in cysteine biosynthesis
MIAALLLAVADAFAPRQSRALLLSVVIAVLALALVWGGATVLLAGRHPFANAWLDAPLEVLGSFAVLALAWLLFPAVVTFVLSFFLDGILAGLERQHYPDLPPPRVGGAGALVLSALRLLALTVLLNVLVLPLYLIPPLIPLVYYGLNGYLLGREYFELIALRRLDRAAARATWRRHRGQLLAAGVAIAVLLSLPVANLAAPLVGAALMLHLFEGLRRDGAVSAASFRRGRYG